MARQIANPVDIFLLENSQLRISIAPSLGGKILSVFNKVLGREFLWSNKDIELTAHEPGADYDSNFSGGIDELIPNDIPEIIDGIAYPDHGELWTCKLACEKNGNSILVHGLLPLSGLHYSKTVSLDSDAPQVYLDYNIRNDAGERRHFLWKLHAALQIEEGDKILTTAMKAQVADPEYSRFKKQLDVFPWPVVEDTDASVVPARDGTMDFLYLFDSPIGEMQLLNKEGHLFSYKYDNAVFPYQWLFASYGGFLNHYTAILEPCTNIPLSVNEAKSLNQTAVLEAGETLHTRVTIFAGEKKNYIQR